MPAFALLFPIEMAVALTAIVHFLNNLFKLILIGRHTRFEIALKFGLPAILFAWLGAQVLVGLPSDMMVGTLVNPIYLDKLLISILILFFALFDLLPILNRIRFDGKLLPLGGALSGFFGGFSGHQGALRSAFLVRLDLSKETFVATGTVIACLIDTTRISVYATELTDLITDQTIPALITAILAAFVGAFVGRQLLKKVTIEFLQITVAVLMMVIALLLGLGFI